jgi:hypothetical protein
MRVHEMWTKSGDVAPGAFKDRDGGMSTDWERYSTPEETRSRAKNPHLNKVIAFVAGDVRSIERLTVVHEPVQEGQVGPKGEPIPPNRSHSEVFGEKTEEVRLKLSRLYTWKIRLNTPE